MRNKPNALHASLKIHADHRIEKESRSQHIKTLKIKTFNEQYFSHKGTQPSYENTIRQPESPTSESCSFSTIKDRSVTYDKKICPSFDQANKNYGSLNLSLQKMNTLLIPSAHEHSSEPKSKICHVDCNRCMSLSISNKKEDKPFLTHSYDHSQFNNRFNYCTPSKYSLPKYYSCLSDYKPSNRFQNSEISRLKQTLRNEQNIDKFIEGTRNLIKQKYSLYCSLTESTHMNNKESILSPTQNAHKQLNPRHCKNWTTQTKKINLYTLATENHNRDSSEYSSDTASKKDLSLQCSLSLSESAKNIAKKVSRNHKPISFTVSETSSEMTLQEMFQKWRGIQTLKQATTTKVAKKLKSKEELLKLRREIMKSNIDPHIIKYNIKLSPKRVHKNSHNESIYRLVNGGRVCFNIEKLISDSNKRYVAEKNMAAQAKPKKKSRAHRKEVKVIL